MIGEIVGNFRVIRQLGTGGMGEVWLAEHKDIHTKVAIKLLLPHISADHAQVQRFFNEAVAVSKIKHAGITKIFDVGFHASGRAYLVMEFLDGEPLAKRIQRTGQLPLPQLADIARQIASVLEATHREGITHRDLKPDNIFVVPDAEQISGERVKVLDFGIAKLGGSTHNLTGAGAMGTPGYMSPEQWRSSAKVDGRADLYSLGCLVFEMATGRPPFLSDSIATACEMHLHGKPPSVRSIVPTFPPNIDAVVAGLLAKEPEQRPGAIDVRNVFATFAPSHTNQGSATTLGGAAVSMPSLAEAKPRRRGLLVAFGVLAVAGVATAGYLATRDTDSNSASASASGSGNGSSAPIAATVPTPPTTTATTRPDAAPPPPAIAHLHVTTTPADAEVRLDGALVEDHKGTFPRGGVSHRLEIAARGFKTDARMITFDDDREVTVALEKDAAPVATKPAHVAHEPKKPVETAATVKTPEPPPATGSAAKPNEPGKKGYRGTQGTIITTYPGGQ